MISEYRRVECQKLVEQYESMVQGELLPACNGEYLEEKTLGRKLLRRYLKGEELDEIRKEIRTRKALELKAMALWDDRVDYSEETGEFYGSACTEESYHEVLTDMGKSLKQEYFYPVELIDDFLRDDKKGSILIISSVQDDSVFDFVLDAFSRLSFEVREKTAFIYCSTYSSVLELFFSLKYASEKGLTHLVIAGIGDWIGLSRYGEQVKLYIEELGLIVIGYGGSPYAITTASREAFGDYVKVLSNTYRYYHEFSDSFPEDARHSYDIYHHMKDKTVDDLDDWFSRVASDIRRGWSVSRSPEYDDYPDGALLKAEIEAVIWNASMDYIASCLWDEMDYGERFWYKVPNNSLRSEAVRTISECNRNCPYPYIGISDSKAIIDALVDMGILIKVYSDGFHYITPIPWLMGIYIHRFEDVFQRVLMEKRCHRPKDAYRFSLGFAFSFSERYIRELELTEKSEVEFCNAVRIDWVYKEDEEEKYQEEKAREKRVVERHGWSHLGLED